MAEKSSIGTMQTGGKNMVWFGEIKRKLAKLSMLRKPLSIFQDFPARPKNYSSPIGRRRRERRPMKGE
jgi:hypothetical protein